MVNVDSWWDSLTRDRIRAVLELVLGAVSDDYESVEIIVDAINKWDTERGPDDWAARSAVPVSRPEVIRSLRELTRGEYVQSFEFDGRDFVAVDFREDSIGDCWFYATRKGIDAIKKILGEEEP